MIFFFYGPNSFAARQQISKLITQYKEKSGGDFGLERIDGAKAKPDELRAALQAMPFLANSRLVIIEDLGLNKSVSPKITDYIKDVPSTTVGVFYDRAADKRTSYFKTLKAEAKDIEFELLDTVKLQQWVGAEAERSGGSLERPAIRRLLELAGEDQWRLSNEIGKLVAYQSPVTVQAVDTLVEGSSTETIFTLVEAMTAGNAGRALGLYHELKTGGENEIYILSMVIWQIRNLLLAKTAGRVDASGLAKKASISPYVAGKALGKRHLFREEALKEAFLRAVDTDYRIKTGDGKADVLVEQLIRSIATTVTV